MGRCHRACERSDRRRGGDTPGGPPGDGAEDQSQAAGWRDGTGHYRGRLEARRTAVRWRSGARLSDTTIRSTRGRSWQPSPRDDSRPPTASSSSDPAHGSRPRSRPYHRAEARRAVQQAAADPRSADHRGVRSEGEPRDDLGRIVGVDPRDRATVRGSIAMRSASLPVSSDPIRSASPRARAPS